MMFNTDQYTGHSLDDLQERYIRVKRQLSRPNNKRWQHLLEIELEYIKELMEQIKRGEVKERP